MFPYGSWLADPTRRLSPRARPRPTSPAAHAIVVKGLLPGCSRAHAENIAKIKHHETLIRVYSLISRPLSDVSNFAQAAPAPPKPSSGPCIAACAVNLSSAGNRHETRKHLPYAGNPSWHRDHDLPCGYRNRDEMTDDESDIPLRRPSRRPTDPTAPAARTSGSSPSTSSAARRTPRASGT